MKKSPLKRVSDKRLKEINTGVKRVSAAKQVSTLLSKGTKRIQSRKVYVGDVLCDSQWEAQKFIELLWRERAGEIKDLKDHVIITFKVFNEAGDYKQFQINIDFEYFDKNLNRVVRVDRKSTKKLVKKNQADWLMRWDLLKFSQPDCMYELEYMR